MKTTDKFQENTLIMRKPSLLVLAGAVLGLFISCLPSGVACQSSRNLTGTWVWQSRPNKKHESTLFSLDIKQKGNKVSGQMWFGMLVDGENDGSDSSSIPFIGTISGNRVTIEFDPNDIHSIEDENVRYKRPRSPAVAYLDWKNGKLQWTESKGVLDHLGLGPLRSFVLSRSKQ
jgi:hypothetical protein